MQNYQWLCRKFRVDTIGDIRWVHAVNSRAQLRQATANRNIHVIEGDVRVLPDGELAMAHGESYAADLLFEDWLSQALQSGKGIKVDWKDKDSFAKSVAEHQNILRSAPFLFCNADILKGPGGDVPSFSPNEFVSSVQAVFPEAILSLGWRTKYEPGLFYTPDMIDAMLSAVSGTSALVTFAVRVCYIKDSWMALQRLLSNPRHSLTFWNNEPVGPQLREWIYKNTDPERCFYDLQFDKYD